jgi:hypothetical protein
LRERHPEKRIHPPDLLVDCLGRSATGSYQFDGEQRPDRAKPDSLLRLYLPQLTSLQK